jgi:hypothetical protein
MPRLLLLLACLVPVSGALAAAGDACRNAYEAGDYPRAHRLCMPLARAGDSAAQYIVARLYEGGRDLPRSDEKAEQPRALALLLQDRLRTLVGAGPRPARGRLHDLGVSPVETRAGRRSAPTPPGRYAVQYRRELRVLRRERTMSMCNAGSEPAQRAGKGARATGRGDGPKRRQGGDAPPFERSSGCRAIAASSGSRRTPR